MKRVRQAAARDGFPKALRLQVEALEDRCLLSTFSVLNTADSGSGFAAADHYRRQRHGERERRRPLNTS
jgi:hypothetical protein